MKKITIYTDGACSYNPGPGGWGAILMYGDYVRKFSGGEAMTTNNRMELTAVISALSALREECDVDLYSDSAYVVNAYQNSWIQGWAKKGWAKADGKKVLNDDLWKELYRLTDKHKVNFIKVKGHSDNKYNNECDKLARAEVDKLLAENGVL